MEHEHCYARLLCTQRILKAVASVERGERVVVSIMDNIGVGSAWRQRKSRGWRWRRPRERMASRVRLEGREDGLSIGVALRRGRHRGRLNVTSASWFPEGAIGVGVMPASASGSPEGSISFVVAWRHRWRWGLMIVLASASRSPEGSNSAGVTWSSWEEKEKYSL